MKIYRYCYKLKIYQLILLGILFPLIFSTIVAIFYEWLGIIDNTVENEELRVSIPALIAMITIGPLLETYLFQYFPLIIVHHLCKGHKYHYHITVLLSAIVFAVIHPHEPFYFTAMLALGLTLSFTCLIFIRKNRHPVLYTSLIHAGYNCILLIVRMFFLDFDLIK